MAQQVTLPPKPGAPLGSLGGSVAMPLGMGAASGAGNVVQPPYQPPLNYTAPTAGTFTGQGNAPTSTPYGAFTAPDPTQVANDPAYQFRAAEGQKAIERSAAAHGTLLNGGTLKALEGYRQGLASEEGQNIFNRALSAYDTNRATNQQNFGQTMDTYQGNLAGFNANTAAQQGAGSLGLQAATAGYDRAREASQDQYGYQQALANPGADAYAQAVAAARAQPLTAESAASKLGMVPGTMPQPAPWSAPKRGGWG